MVHLILAEKPTAAKKIAESILNEFKTKKKYSVNYSVNYYESEDGLVVAPAAGHLFTLKDKTRKKYPNFDLEWQPSFKKNKFTKEKNIPILIWNGNQVSKKTNLQKTSINYCLIWESFLKK